MPAANLPTDEIALGVDFGTSSIRAAYWDDKLETAVPINFSKNGNKNSMPPTFALPAAVVFNRKYKSLISFKNNNDEKTIISDLQCLVGQDALDAVLNNHSSSSCDVQKYFPLSNLILHLTRIIGRRFSDPVVTSVINSQICPCKIVSDPSISNNNNACHYQIETHQEGVFAFIRPEEVLARLLIAVKHFANLQLIPLCKKVRHIVVCIPSHFSSTQRRVILDACYIAGIRNLRILSHSMACSMSALIAHHGSPFFSTAAGEVGTMLLHVGSGMTSATFATLEDGIAEAKSCGGDSLLGGDDIDLRLVNFFLFKFFSKKQNDVKEGKIPQLPNSMRNFDAFLSGIDFGTKMKLKRMCESAKIELSSSTSTTLEFTFNIHQDDNSNDNNETETEHFRIDFNREDYKDICGDIFHNTISILLNEIHPKLNPHIHRIDRVLLSGLSTRDCLIRDALTEFIRKKQSHRSSLETTKLTDEEILGKFVFECQIDDEFSVCQGGAAMAAILIGSKSSQLTNLLMLDVTPSSLGIEIAGGNFHALMRQHTTIPSKFNQVFSTFVDNQPAVSVQIFEGNAAQTSACLECGKFELTGLPYAPKGTPQIDVTFDVDTNGIVSVSAEERSTGRKSMISINKRGQVELEGPMVGFFVEHAAKYSDAFRKQEWYKRREDEIIDSLENPFATWKAAADAAFVKNENERAVEFWRKASAADPTNAVVHSNMSFAYLKLKDAVQCEKEASICIEKNPTWWKGFFRKAKCCEILLNDKDRALAMYQEALKRAVDDANVEEELKLAIATLLSLKEV